MRFSLSGDMLLSVRWTHEVLGHEAPLTLQIAEVQHRAVEQETAEVLHVCAAVRTPSPLVASEAAHFLNRVDRNQPR